MTRSYFRTMFACVLVSFFLLAGATILHFPPWAAMIGGIAPLLYYHLFYLVPQAKSGLSHSAIDSVYYFGFLITIMALGISAISIAVRGASSNVNTIVYQFGVGLIATGYAVVARMHLTSLAVNVADASPEVVMDRYVQRSMELVTNAELASSRFSEFSKTLMAKTTEVTEAARLSAEKTMLDVAKVFADEMKTTLAMARDGLVQIRGLVADTSFVAEREELARSMKATIEATAQLNKALEELAGRSREGAQATQQAISSSTVFDETLRKIAIQIADLGGERGTLTQSSASLRTATQTMVECSQSMATAVSGLSEMSDAIANTGPSFKNLRLLTQKVNEQLEGLATASEKMESALGVITDAALASDTLAVGLHKVTTAILPLADNAGTLTSNLERASAVSARFEQQLTRLPDQVDGFERLGEEAMNAMRQISQAVEEAMQNAQQLSAHTANSALAADGANRLLSSANELQAAVSSLQRLFASLGDSVIATQKALSDSSSNINLSIADSADALEANVRRSTEAASLLTNRLAQVAQNIIDRTRQSETI